MQIFTCNTVCSSKLDSMYCTLEMSALCTLAAPLQAANTAMYMAVCAQV